MILGLDVSAYQTALPWPQFFAAGRRFAIVKVSENNWADRMAAAHIAGARAAGLEVAFYHFLGQSDGLLQARTFARLAPIDNTLLYGLPRYWVDVEAGINLSGVLTAFLYAWKSLTSAAIGIYTGAGAWADTVGNEHTEFGVYPLWNGSRPLPAGWTRAAIQQNPVASHLPGYAGDLDLDEIPGVTMSVPIITHGSKVGFHSITHAQLLPLVRKFAAAGVTLPLVKSVNDASPFAEIKRISPRTLTLCRYIGPVGKWEDIQDPQTWDDATRQAFARESVDLIFRNANAEQREHTDWFAVENEPSRVSVADTVRALIPLCREATARGVSLALPAWSQGEPEWADMLALADPALHAAMLAGGHIWDVHEGPLGSEPVDSGYGAHIPGAPYVDGAGAFFFRYRYQYAAFAARGLSMPPLVISEAYYGGPDYRGPIPDLLVRVQWVDARVRRDPYVLAVCGFTVDPDVTWRDQDYTPLMASNEMLDYLVSVKDQPNGEPDMPNVTDADYAALVAANNQQAAILAKYRPAPAWKVGDVALAVANPLQLYDAAHNASGAPRPNYTSDINILAVTADGQWLKVFANPEFWVRSADVKHRP